MTDHSAGASAIGFSYQTRVGLLQIVRLGAERPDGSISLELHDDVAWESAGSPSELLQLKHHITNQPSLTDKSTDLWRTFGVWLDRSDAADPAGPGLRLVTTATAPDSTAAAYLRPEGRNELQAVDLLAAAATDSVSATTEHARSKFTHLGSAGQQIFLSKVQVWDGAQDIMEIDPEIRKALMWALPNAHADLFMELLWGWWDAEVLAMLRGSRGPLQVSEVMEHVQAIRDQFTADRLPTLLNLTDIDQVALYQAHSARPLVQQLRLVDCPPMNIQKAVVDYYRAYVHSTRWLDEDLINTSELANFETELIDEWQREFEFATHGLGPGVSEGEKCSIGVALLRKLLEANQIRIRARYDEPFFARGKRHDLADRLQIGWHPDYVALLSSAVSSN